MPIAYPTTGGVREVENSIGLKLSVKLDIFSFTDGQAPLSKAYFLFRITEVVHFFRDRSTSLLHAPD